MRDLENQVTKAKSSVADKMIIAGMKKGMEKLQKNNSELLQENSRLKVRS